MNQHQYHYTLYWEFRNKIAEYNSSVDIQTNIYNKISTHIYNILTNGIIYVYVLYCLVFPKKKYINIEYKQIRVSTFMDHAVKTLVDLERSTINNSYEYKIVSNPVNTEDAEVVISSIYNKL